MNTPEDTELREKPIKEKNMSNTRTVGELVGQASMLFYNEETKLLDGVFDEKQAQEIVDKIEALIDLHTQKHELAAEKRGVAWTIGIIDEMHEIDSPIRDSHYKGIKSAIRETYQKDTGNGDPAPNYPIKVHLTNPAEGSEA